MMITSKSYVQLGLMIIILLLIGTVQGKDRRCHRPVLKDCDSSESYIPGWKFTGWYYDTVLRACRPLFTKNGSHICKENYDLPYTRETCEELCSDPCTMSTGAPGICMFKEICKMYNHLPYHYKTCGNDDLNCCPKIPDRHLRSFGALQDERKGIVEVGVVKNIKDPAYPPNAYHYYFFLPHNFSKDGKSYY